MRPDSTIYRLQRPNGGKTGPCLIHREISLVGPAAGGLAEHELKLKVLDPRLDLTNHSPDGFEWGYAGSGPAQSALAILADFTEDDDLALKLYQRFKVTVIQPMDHEGGTITGEQIRLWLKTFGESEERTITVAELVLELADLEGPERAVVARSPAGNYSIRIYVHETLE